MSPASAYAVRLKSHKSPGDLTFQEEESKGFERLGASLKVTQPGRGTARVPAALLAPSASLPFVGIVSCASRSIALWSILFHLRSILGDQPAQANWPCGFWLGLAIGKSQQETRGSLEREVGASIPFIPTLGGK